MDELTIEKEYRARGFEYVAGVDEVGRGPLAGPVVCAAVIMPLDEDKRILGVDDSKKLSKKKRKMLSEEIKERALAYAIAEIDADTIDEINILQATRLCMKRAVESLPIVPSMVLTDGNMSLDIDLPQRSIVKGDALVYSIGAASILAKVYRDEMMCRLSADYPGYGFEKNKGYGTQEHIQAIGEIGLCKIHRKTFVRKLSVGKGSGSSSDT